MQRISISLSKRDLELWTSTKGDLSLSAFVRKAVNEYIKIQEPGMQSTIFDLIVNQRIQFEKIENDLLDITAALARVDLIDFDPAKNEWKIKRG